MRIVVTGAAGKVGPWIVSGIAAHGHEVIAADHSDVMLKGVSGAAESRVIDVTDVGQMASILSGADAVVHLAAIAYPTAHPPEVVFRNNVVGTFAVLQAASLTGVRRAVIASSMSLLGMAFAPQRFPPRYLPVDEAHPGLGQEAYALSKAVDEQTAQMFCRLSAMTIRAVRFTYVAVPGEAATLVDPVDEDEIETRTRELWAYVDARDAAAACRLGVEVDGHGFQALNISATDSLSKLPTAELARRYYPDVELRGPIDGHASLISTDKASALLGFESEYTWRDEPPTSGSG